MVAVACGATTQHDEIEISVPPRAGMARINSDDGSREIAHGEYRFWERMEKRRQAQ